MHFENIPTALPPEISLCLYRVLQEALQNVVKHSVSRHAHVSLNGQINTINLTVKDSGAGFDPHEAMRGPGLGLTSMKERLKVVGGQLSIHSQRGTARRFTRSRLSVSQRSLQMESCDAADARAKWRGFFDPSADQARKVARASTRFSHEEAAS